MVKMRSTLLWVFTFLVGMVSFAQQNPAVTNPTIPNPIVGGTGTVFTITFKVGNNGAYPINGQSGPPTPLPVTANRMGFSFTFLGSEPVSGTASSGIASFSGSFLTKFDIVYNSAINSYDALQKYDEVVDQMYDLVINAKVTQISSNTMINEIGVSINIAPSGNSIGIPDPSDQTGGNLDSDDQARAYSHTTLTTALPVSLVKFTAQAQENRTVLLDWSTSWERSNKGYIIERSKDLKSFEQVGQVNDVAGTSNSINTYSFTDGAPYRGTSYYRLRQQDVDGSIHTYKAEPVVIEGRYGVYPNPVVSQQFTLELDEPATAAIRLFNISGSELAVEKSDLKEMSTKLTPNAKLPTGVYVLTVEERGITRKHRLVVQ